MSQIDILAAIETEKTFDVKTHMNSLLADIAEGNGHLPYYDEASNSVRANVEESELTADQEQAMYDLIKDRPIGKGVVYRKVKITAANYDQYRGIRIAITK